MRWIPTQIGLIRLDTVAAFLVEDNILTAILQNGQRVLVGEYGNDEEASNALNALWGVAELDVIDFEPSPL